MLESQCPGKGAVHDVLGRHVAAFDARGAARFEVTLPDLPGMYVRRVATTDGLMTQRVVQH